MHQYKWYRTLVVVLLIATNWLLVTCVTTWLVAYGREAVFTYGKRAGRRARGTVGVWRTVRLGCHVHCRCAGRDV